MCPKLFKPQDNPQAGILRLHLAPPWRTITRKKNIVKWVLANYLPPYFFIFHVLLKDAADTI